MIKDFFILWLLFLVSQPVNLNAQRFEFNAACQAIYQDIIALKLESGEKKLRIEQKFNPNNQFPILLENYIDFLSVYTSGSLDEYYAIKSKIDKRIAQIKDSNEKDPYHLYAQSELHIHSAVLHIKFGEYLPCVFDIKKALKKLERNDALYPNFAPNDKSLGMLYAILGSIPQEYHGALSFLGLKRDVNKGIALLKKSVDTKSNPFQHESATIYAYMLLHIQNNPEKAWQVLLENNFEPSMNVMDAYSLGHIGIYGLYNDKGIAALEQRPKSAIYKSFPLINYLLGLGKTYRQDDDANVFFQQFLAQNEGEDYIKSALQKMAWNYLIQGKTNLYKSTINRIKGSGRAVIDADKQAEREAKNEYSPNAILLKARLLTDGNYLHEATEILEQKTVNSFTSLVDKTEYFYRLARLYDKRNIFESAENFYKLTIQNGTTIPHYYAANAAYLLGYLYEKKGKNTSAIDYYEICLQLEGYEYENSIHQKAEAGLNRLNQ